VKQSVTELLLDYDKFFIVTEIGFYYHVFAAGEHIFCLIQGKSWVSLPYTQPTKADFFNRD
jgi:hypothetical protein